MLAETARDLTLASVIEPFFKLDFVSFLQFLVHFSAAVTVCAPAELFAQKKLQSSVTWFHQHPLLHCRVGGATGSVCRKM